LYKYLLLFIFIASNGQAANSNVVSLAPGYGDLTYALPKVGDYTLPVLAHAADGVVLNTQGQVESLHEIYKGKYTLLSFIYSHCGDVNGCPLSSHVFNQLKSKMNNDPVLADHLQLLSISFDPERDTPEMMKQYGDNFRFSGNKGLWKFLTTSSVKALSPILENYNQDIQREMSVSGENTGDISHILRVFLIDPKMDIRNIYSVGFLHADLVVNDLRTLMINYSFKQKELASTIVSQTAVLSVPGDAKDGYENESYVTQSKAITERKGREADLLSIANNPPLGLPKIISPKDNALTEEKIKLGRKLFYDRRLSLNSTI